MESDNKNLFQKNIDLKDVNLAAAAAARRKYQKLICVFKFLFFALTLIIGALIIYLVRDIPSDSQSDRSIHLRSIHLNYPNDPIDNTQLLERAAEELENVTSLILLKYLLSNTETTAAQFALKACRTSLLIGSGQIRRAVEANRVNQIRRAVGSIKACVDDLGKVESTGVSEVRGKVVGVMVDLRDWGDLLENVTQKEASSTIAANWGLVMKNLLFLVCVGGLQLSFIIYLLWAVIRF